MKIVFSIYINKDLKLNACISAFARATPKKLTYKLKHNTIFLSSIASSYNLNDCCGTLIISNDNIKKITKNSAKFNVLPLTKGIQ